MTAIIFPDTKKRAWITVAFLTGTIYATLGIVRPLVNFLKSTGLLHPVVILFLLLFIGLLAYLIAQNRPISTLRWILFALLLLIYAFALKFTVVATEERIHFIEYGILALFTFRALSFDVKNEWLVYLYSLSIVSLIGYVDEVIQYFLPSRVYDIRDVGLNALSALLMLIFIKCTAK